GADLGPGPPVPDVALHAGRHPRLCPLGPAHGRVADALLRLGPQRALHLGAGGPGADRRLREHVPHHAPGEPGLGVVLEEHRGPHAAGRDPDDLPRLRTPGGAGRGRPRRAGAGRPRGHVLQPGPAGAVDRRRRRHRDAGPGHPPAPLARRGLMPSPAPEENPMHVPAALAACLALAALPLLAAPAAAADRECGPARSESRALDLGDARAVVVHVGASRLRLEGRPGRDGRLEGRACASSEDGLGRLRLEQAREGDTLVVRLRREDGPSSWFRANRYAYFDLSGTVPDGIPVTLAVGSGDAWATGLSALDLTVGSGDADARRIRGNVDARVGSGDIT